MIKIMLDSAADCRNDEIYDYLVPMTVSINGKEYHDGVDIDADTFYSLLQNTEDFPRTSQPSPEDFLKSFEEVKNNGDELIYFALSSSFSGTYQSANIAKNIVNYDKIHIIDTKTATHLIEILAIYARRLINEGLTAKEIVRKCEEIKSKIRIFAGVGTLEYLQKGGRIGKAAAFVGNLANIQPLLTISQDGIIDTFGKALGINRAVQGLAEKFNKFNINTDFPICSLYTFGTENCEKLEQKLQNEGVIIDSREQIGPTIGTHTGPGVYGIFFVEK